MQCICDICHWIGCKYLESKDIMKTFSLKVMDMKTYFSVKALFY